MTFYSVEICAGAGGQALGLEQAGFHHVTLLEIDKAACTTLRSNRKKWNVLETDIRDTTGRSWKGIDLLAGGVPCPPFSKAGKQLGEDDERDLFPEALRLAFESKPKALLLENVRGLLDPIFSVYRENILNTLRKHGYIGEWRLLNASDYGVPQLRPRAILVALKKEIAPYYSWPKKLRQRPQTVGETLFDLMNENNWYASCQWKDQANTIAPTLVGGSKKHGGPDLGPTRAKNAWAAIGVDGHGLADSAPEEEFEGMPRLTVRMTARIQGFPDEWEIIGKKTAAYRQVGNAFPPPVAKAVGKQIFRALYLSSL